MNSEDRAVLNIIKNGGSNGIKSRDLNTKRIRGSDKTVMQIAHRLRSMKLVRMERLVSGDQWTLTDAGEDAL